MGAAPIIGCLAHSGQQQQCAEGTVWLSEHLRIAVAAWNGEWEGPLTRRVVAPVALLNPPTPGYSSPLDCWLPLYTLPLVPLGWILTPPKALFCSTQSHHLEVEVDCPLSLWPL